MKYINSIIALVNYKKYFLPIVPILYIILTVIELAGFSLALPFIHRMFGNVNIENNFINFLNFSYDLDINLLGLVIILIFFLKSFLTFFLLRFVLSYCFKQGIKLRLIIYEIYQNLDFSDLKSIKSSELIYNLTSAIEYYFREVLQSFIKIIGDSILIISLFTFLLILNSSLFFALFFFILIIGFAYSNFYARKLKTYGIKVNESFNNIIKFAEETVSSLSEIRVLKAESFLNNKINKASLQHFNFSLKSELIANYPRIFIDSILIAFLILSTIFLRQIIDDASEIIAILSIFSVVLIRCIPLINSLFQSFALLRLRFDVVTLLTKIVKLEQKAKKEKQSLLSIKINKLIELKNIFFSYEENNHVLKNICIKINKNDKVAIIGKSGSGKTTLINIIMGLQRFTIGQIVIDGKRVNQSSRYLIENCGYLSQNTFLINDTIINNIILNQKFDEKKFNQAVNFASLKTFFDKSKNFQSLKIGDDGLNLSTGEKQRIGMARLFYNNPEIIIMDEPFASIDKNTSLEIIENIKNSWNKKTIIIITHQDFFNFMFDKTFSIENGTIKKND